MKKTILLFVILIISLTSVNAQRVKTDANIVGHVVSNGEHIPFATISVKGTTIGTTTDMTGHFLMLNLPEGDLVIRAQSIGYKPQEKEISINSGDLIEINFDLEPDVMGLEEVVVTGDRNERNRRESSVIVNTLTPKLFNVVNSVSLSDGLNFSPGLRLEYNCQNCGFNQVRMNGMEGSYTQILINGRPIFSGLAGVYGLELIPSSMLERIEVIRGGGSALYGSNAIAGTINLILRDPINSTFEFGVNSGFTGIGMNNSGPLAADYSVNANVSVVSDDHKTGMALYGFYRDRDPFDANGDGFSELTAIQNTTFGTRLYHRIGYRSKITADFFNIKEYRRGGDMFDQPVHQANVAESLGHDITTGALSFDRFFRGTDLWSSYISGQRVMRDSYYGAEQSLNDYGKTKGLTMAAGTYYNAVIAKSNLTVGIDTRIETLNDRKLGYPNIDNALIENGAIVHVPHAADTLLADQLSNTVGLFAQFDKHINLLNISVGGRFDSYNIADQTSTGLDNSGNVFSPRITFKYDLSYDLQARVSYSQGYRAPQIFDEDLHTEASALRQVIHRNAPNLKRENSHSYMTSLDYNSQIGNYFFGFLAEGFYTVLNNAFVSEFGDPDENGLVVYTRQNAEEGAVVRGVNLEMNFIPNNKVSITSGFTVQQSFYEEPQEFGEKRFFRTPNDYGYLTLDWSPLKRLGLSADGTYTGSMLVPYFGLNQTNPEAGELRESNPFFDLGLKFRYDAVLNGATFQVYGGVKNLFNSYQRDFDSGAERDPGYIYGPGQPRSIYLGIKIGNFLR